MGWRELLQFVVTVGTFFFRLVDRMIKNRRGKKRLTREESTVSQ